MDRGPIRALTHRSQPVCCALCVSLSLLQQPSEITLSTWTQRVGVCYLSSKIRWGWMLTSRRRRLRRQSRPLLIKRQCEQETPQQANRCTHGQNMFRFVWLRCLSSAVNTQRYLNCAMHLERVYCTYSSVCIRWHTLRLKYFVCVEVCIGLSSFKKAQA